MFVCIACLYAIMIYWHFTCEYTIIYIYIYIIVMQCSKLYARYWLVIIETTMIRQLFTYVHCSEWACIPTYIMASPHVTYCTNIHFNNLCCDNIYEVTMCDMWRRTLWQHIHLPLYVVTVYTFWQCMHYTKVFCVRRNFWIFSKHTTDTL